ncbi:MAG: hypothetical protein P8Y45_24920, partial [Exilibacterium sp.]
MTVYLQRLLHFIRRHEKTLNIANIAYTLQVGREAMEARVAFVVADIPELIATLQKDNAGALCHRGNTSKSAQTIKALAEGEVGETLLRMILQQNQLSRLASLWVNGAELDWNLLYEQTGLPCKIALPTYPFSPHRYWLPEPENTGFSRSEEDPEGERDHRGAGLARLDDPVFQKSLEAHATQPALRRFHQGYKDLEKFAHQILMHSFQRMEIMDSTSTEVAALPETFTRFYSAAKHILTRTDVVSAEADWHTQYNRLKQQFPEVRAYLELLVHCVEHYPKILRCELLPTQVMFPDSSLEKVEGVQRRLE